jgi:hypothetical protein
MITLSILVAVLTLGWGIRTLALWAMATVRKAMDVKPVEQVPVR